MTSSEPSLRSSRAALALTLIGLTAWTAAIVLDLIGPDATRTEATDLVWAASFVGPVLLGGFLAARRPGNAVGWLLAAGPTLIGIGVALQEYAEAGVAATPVWPAIVPAVLTGQVVFAPGLLVLLGAFVVFPDGRLPSPRWRRPTHALLVVVALLTVATALQPQLINNDGTVTYDNPIGIEALAPVAEFTATSGISITIVVALFALAVSLTIRVRRGDAQTRRQLAWLAAPVAVLVALILVATIAEALGNPVLSWLLLDSPAFTVFIFAVPAAIVVAVTRYRLYEIDRIVGRTVTYTFVTGVLAAIYGGSVVVLRTALEPVVGGSDLSVAASTLVVVALFGPVRRRVRRSVDRRFDRARYDAAAAVERFGQTVRDEVDLDEVTAALRDTAVRSLQPANVTLWTPDAQARP